ncbi:hypothetical protein AF72_02100 [Xylella taiwanensis]|uniref:Uncharacterized protein n=1 Tax=Xylella taiwanensis TaxID=1444770 RepID=Z9JMW4_9GAMM|nr:hypothetical protein AF72_02100 [Xylella taiwanensis]
MHEVACVMVESSIRDFRYAKFNVANRIDIPMMLRCRDVEGA